MKKLLLVTLVLGLSNATFAAERTNFDVFRDVSAQVNRYAYFTIFDSVSARVDAGYVTLSGKVTMPFKALDIEKRVANVDGVKGVRARPLLASRPVEVRDRRPSVHSHHRRARPRHARRRREQRDG